MPDSDRLWTTVGSAGTLNQADLAKVTLHQSIVQLGTALAPPPAVAAEGASAESEAASAPELQLPTIQAVVRYNVTPVDGLFFTPGSGLHYFLKLRCRGNVSARLVEVDLQTGAEAQRILLNSNTANFQLVVKEENPTAPESKVMDFVEKAYYVEATLTASAVVIGHPAAIQIIKIQPDAIIQ
jgi:hypothetical protein